MQSLTRPIEHAWILAWEDVREAFCRKRAFLALFFYAGVVGVSIWILVRLQDRVPNVSAFAAGDEHGVIVQEALRRLGAPEWEEVFMALLRTPAAVWIFQLLSLMWFPVLVTLVSYDAVAGDLSRGTVRYLVQRTGRFAYLLGKLAGHTAIYLLLHIAAWIVLLGVCAVRLEDFSLAGYMPAAAMYFAVSVPYLLFIVSSTEFVSSLCRRPAHALVWVHLLWVWFFAALLLVPWASPFRGRMSAGLLAPFEGWGFVTACSMLLWAAGFFAAAVLIFRRRDL